MHDTCRGNRSSSTTSENTFFSMQSRVLPRRGLPLLVVDTLGFVERFVEMLSRTAHCGQNSSPLLDSCYIIIAIFSFQNIYARTCVYIYILKIY